MSARAIGFRHLLMLAFFYPAVAAAQPSPANKSIDDLRTAVKNVSARVEAQARDLESLKSDLTSVRQELAAASAGSDQYITKAEFRRMQADLQDLIAVVKDGNDSLGSMVTKDEFERTQADLQDVIAVVKDKNDLLGTVVAEISALGGKGKSIPDVRAIMEDVDGRKALGDAVHQLMRRSGALVVENRLDRSYRLLVNDLTYYDIPPRKTKRIPVRLGTITTELVGFEEPKHWSVGPPHYAQNIVIGPRRTSSVGVAPAAAQDEPLER